jgi:hypothetical protein
MEDGKVLEGLDARELFLEDGGGFAHQGDALRRGLADHPCCKGGTREGLPCEELPGEPQGLADLPDAGLSETDQRLDEGVPELLLRIDAQLGQDVVLPLHPCHGLLDVGEDGPLRFIIRL